MDLELIPLRIELDALVTLKVNLFVVKIQKIIFQKRIWDYTSPSITAEIFNINDAEPDKTPPTFSGYSRVSLILSFLLYFVGAITLVRWLSVCKFNKI